MFVEELETLLCTNKSGIWIKSELEKEVYIVLLNTLKANGFDNIIEWTAATGLSEVEVNKDGVTKKAINKNPGINLVLNEFNKIQEDKTQLDSSAIILKDVNCRFNDPATVRTLREMLEVKNDKYIPIIILSAIYEDNAYLSHLFKILDYDSMDLESIEELLTAYSQIKQVSIDIEKTKKMFLGFSRQEIIDLLNVSFYKYNELNLDMLKQKKIEMIKSCDVLDLVEPKLKMSDIGGNTKFKNWYEESKLCMSNAARIAGLDMPKGYLALGIPGCSKSALAQSIANDLDVPMLQLRMNNILSKFVGESERKMRKAQEIIESCAPCVLLIDEVEKSLGGYKSSNSSDSGTLARVFGTILEMLNDNDKGIFTIMTSNNVEDLPPELTRAGRLDAIWYFSLPTQEEREEIFKIHLGKKNLNVSSTTVKEIAEETEGYTGAEIEQIVKASMRKGFLRCTKASAEFKLNKNDLMQAKQDVIPIAESSKEQISKLEAWVKGRALYANGNTIKIQKRKITSDSIQSASKLLKK